MTSATMFGFRIRCCGSRNGSTCSGGTCSGSAETESLCRFALRMLRVLRILCTQIGLSRAGALFRRSVDTVRAVVIRVTGLVQLTGLVRLIELVGRVLVAL